jgi:hypothetical protein
MARTAAEQEPARLALRVDWPDGDAPLGTQANAHELSLLLAPLPLAYPRPAATTELTLLAASATAPAGHYREAIERLRGCAWSGSASTLRDHLRIPAYRGHGGTPSSEYDTHRRPADHDQLGAHELR